MIHYDFLLLSIFDHCVIILFFLGFMTRPRGQTLLSDHRCIALALFFQSLRLHDIPVTKEEPFIGEPFSFVNEHVDCFFSGACFPRCHSFMSLGII
ncbi:hypothetical protein DM01DRAFT_1132969 [Hesseltinella vesiculosa]|uniref:Uncharacterized protein n=1 Tax=Hesseltinella vesiculosa TaxID=101127 RepID=A0A1X2G9F2_9FUNG|nr:hypothetical protein DM01DRAFT_1132969 [Hesseltinella vesiculosa]